jgi:hypothetical protein
VQTQWNATSTREQKPKENSCANDQNQNRMRGQSTKAIWDCVVNGRKKRRVKQNLKSKAKNTICEEAAQLKLLDSVALCQN